MSYTTFEYSKATIKASGKNIVAQGICQDTRA